MNTGISMMLDEGVDLSQERYRAMYVGRFQIFHKGHLNIAKFIDAQPDIREIVAVIGSSQYSRYKKHPDLPWILNPFTGEERKLMLEMSLEDEIDKVLRFELIEDTHDCPKWFELIDRRVVPEVFYTNSPKEIKLFESYRIPTREVPLLPGGYHAQVIREMIAAGNSWQKYVPKGTVKFIEEYRMDKILRDFYSEHEKEIEIVHQMQIRDGITPYDPNMKY